MLASFILAFREGLEAALIVGVILGVLRKTKKEEYNPFVWWGVGSAVFLSIVIGIGLNYLGTSFEGHAEEIFEGVAMILAASILTWVILWMQTNSREHSQRLETGVKSAILKDSKPALFSLAFLAVIREGVELSFFLNAVSINVDYSQTLIGAALGLAFVIIVSILLFNSLIKLNISSFFRVTSVILIIFAAGLVAHGIHEFNEAGVIPSIVEDVWDTNHILDEKSTTGQLLKVLVGYNGNPSLTEVIGYVLYYFVLWGISLAIKKKEFQPVTEAA